MTSYKTRIKNTKDKEKKIETRGKIQGKKKESNQNCNKV